MARFFPKSELPNIRLFGSMSAMWLVYGLLELSKGPHTSLAITFYLIITLYTAYLWIGYTAIRLADLCVSRLWMLPIIFPVVLFTLALYLHWSLLDRIALTVAIVVQLPLWILPTRKKLTIDTTKNSEESNPA